ncbi:hypothetical protein O181_127439 [Austropuccinia psidii MF-1]|uniref:Uncharacterized protein n=1 Tax=Austropuccinia psidii MF-1 TaxID=1389203 RepID=A0A9Q3KY21_9BASI|nr:hypothetical protein [Austropuccinia psidii MF-1]
MDCRDTKLLPGAKIRPRPRYSKVSIDMAKTKSTQKTKNGPKVHSEATSSMKMGTRPLLGIMERRRMMMMKARRGQGSSGQFIMRYDHILIIHQISSRRAWWPFCWDKVQGSIMEVKMAD